MLLHDLQCGHGRGGRAQEIERARELQAAAAVLPPAALRPAPGFADVAAELAPRRMVASAVSAARAAGMPIPEHLVGAGLAAGLSAAADLTHQGADSLVCCCAAPNTLPRASYLFLQGWCNFLAACRWPASLKT